MIRLIATGLDGTLLEKGGALPEGFYDVAEDLKKLGILLVAASGRQYDNLRRKFQPIAREMGFVCENGGLNAVGRASTPWIAPLRWALPRPCKGLD